MPCFFAGREEPEAAACGLVAEAILSLASGVSALLELVSGRREFEPSAFGRTSPPGRNDGHADSARRNLEGRPKP